MSIGNTYNQTSLDIAAAQYKARLNSPSLKQKQTWHQEFLESGAQYRMAYSVFLKEKILQWQVEKKLRNWIFGGGKYHGKKIKDIIRTDISYINWTLTNSPKGKVSRQIVLYCRNNNVILDVIESNPYLKNLPNPKTKR